MKLNIEQQKALLEEGYKFCFDVVKLIIGGVILAGIMQESINKVLLYGAGFFFIVLFLVIGVWLIILLKEGERNNGTDLFLGAVTFLICGACLTLVYIIHKQEKTEAGA